MNQFDPVTHKQIVLVAAVNSTATKGGIYRSNDAGETFKKVSISGGAPDAPATHMVPDLSSFGVLGNRVYAALVGNSLKPGLAGIYMSQGADVGTTWTKVSTGIPQCTLDHVERIEVTVSAADGTIYAALLGDGVASSAAIAAGTTVINVETPEFFRSGDVIEIGYVPPAKVKVARGSEQDHARERQLGRAYWRHHGDRGRRWKTASHGQQRSG